jgi:hypothetical protein
LKKNAILLFLGQDKGRTNYRRSPQKRTSCTSKHENSLLLSIFGFFALLDPDPDPANQIKADPCGAIRIHNPVINHLDGRVTVMMPGKIH